MNDLAQVLASNLSPVVAANSGVVEASVSRVRTADAVQRVHVDLR